MNNPVLLAARGAAWGVGLTALTLSLSYGLGGLLFLPFICVFALVLAGPGLFVLGLPFAWLLRRLRAPLALAVLLGLPLGVLHAALWSLLNPFDVLHPAALAGGLGLGFGAALRGNDP